MLLHHMVARYNIQTLLPDINFTDLVVFSVDIDLPSHSSSLGQKGVNIDKLYESEHYYVELKYFTHPIALL